jgi:Zn-dependent protease with chaperone function
MIVAWYAAYRIMPIVIGRHATRLGFSHVSDIASLPLLLLTLAMASAVTTPIELAISRHHEREADRFALDLTHANRSYATALIKTTDDDRDPIDPDRGWLAKLLLDTHPSLRERIEFCNSYMPAQRDR